MPDERSPRPLRDPHDSVDEDATGGLSHDSGGRPDPGSRQAGLIALLVTIVFYGLIVAALFAMDSGSQPAEEPDAAQAEPAIEPEGQTPGTPADGAEVIERTRREAQAIVLRLLMAARERLGGDGSFIESQIPVGDPNDAQEQFRIAVMRAELDSRERALETLEEIPERSIENDDARATLAFLRGVYGGGEVEQGDREAALRTIGWWALLAEEDGVPDASVRARALESGRRSLDMLIGVLVAGAVVGVASIVCLIIAIIRIAGGDIRRRLIPPTPGGSVYLEVFAVFLVSFTLVQVVGVLAVTVSPGAGAFAAIAAQWSLAVVPLWALLRGAGFARLRQDLGWHTGRGVLREMGAGIFGYLAGLPIFAAAVVLSQILANVVGGVMGERIEPKNHVLEAITSASPMMIVALVSLVVLWAPLVEETVFRGALLRHVRSRAGIVGGALLTGVLFAFLHSYGPLFTPPLIALGVTFALLREWRGSLIAPMTAHFLHNATLITLMLVFLKSSW